MFSSSSRSPLPSVTNLQVDSVTFPPSVISPASSNPLFLAGTGVQGLNIQGEFVISTVIGVYLYPNAVRRLTFGGWRCKMTEELTESVSFFREIVTGSFEKFIKDYSRGQAVERFLEIFKNKNFPPGASILFALSPEGSLLRIIHFEYSKFQRGRWNVVFLKDDSIPKTSKTVIKNKLLAEAVLESIIGKNGVSPGARFSVAERLSQLMKNNKVEEDATKT
ncbi:hypothetical protein Bca4012_025679 [Brassica carinata]|uniref:Chalcone-flavonone isomerase family protein n=1 Tax=Brassica carinata TaxID=52824 RepID=A0A8X8ATK8_BRACI|nr:hypothetical protein Bca52824_022784 [Brassica carinata]